jgi:hypothetical protein
MVESVSLFRFSGALTARREGYVHGPDSSASSKIEDSLQTCQYGKLGFPEFCRQSILLDSRLELRRAFHSSKASRNGDCVGKTGISQHYQDMYCTSGLAGLELAHRLVPAKYQLEFTAYCHGE